MRVSCVTIDCADPERLVAFWSQALGYVAQGSCCHPPDGIGPYLEFVAVPEPKTVKNRVHLGFNTDDLDAEIGRLVALGATVAWEEDFPPDWRFRNVVLRDPEGNELCLGTSTTAMIRAVTADALATLEDAAGRDLAPDLASRVRRTLDQLRVLGAWPL